MRFNSIINKSLLALGIIAITSCASYDKIVKSNDYDYRYEAAKQCYVEGHYSTACQLLEDILTVFKGTDKGEESLYLLAMSNYGMGDYESASQYFKKYYTSYPKGVYAQEAHFYAGKSLYYGTVDPRLDQSATMTAISEFQNFLDLYPYTALKAKTQNMIYELDDRLVLKEYYSAKLYYDLGDYVGNCTMGGSNYEACIVTSQNALKDYPYNKRREDFSILIVKAKYDLAQQSITAKRTDRYRETIDEAYGFLNEYPESKHLKEVQKILSSSEKEVKAN